MTNDSNHEWRQLQMTKGRKKAFEIVYGHYYVSVFYLAHVFVRDKKIAEDITLEVFSSLWERFPHFTSFHQVQDFLQTTTRRVCGYKEEVSDNQQVIARVYQYIYTQIQQLPPHVRRVFKRAYIQGLSGDEIAGRIKLRNHKAGVFKSLRVAVHEKSS